MSPHDRQAQQHMGTNGYAAQRSTTNEQRDDDEANAREGASARVRVRRFRSTGVGARVDECRGAMGPQTRVWRPGAARWVYFRTFSTL